VSVVTAEEIRNLGARTLEEVLRVLPGFDVLTDSLGRSRVVLRGIEPGGSSETVLLQFNGVPLNEDLNGGATLINLDLPVDHVKRIEVVRGPASALYGGNAFAGVVNIVSSGLEDFEGIGLEAGLGSFATHRLELRLGNSVKGVTISGFVHFTDTDGARLLVPADAQPSTISVAPGRTTDDRRSLETSYRADFKDFTLNLRLKNENSGGFVGLGDTLGTQNDLNNRQLIVDLGYSRALGTAGTLHADVSYGENEVRQLLEVLPPGFERPLPEGIARFPSGVFLQTATNLRRYGAGARVERRLGSAHHLLAGAALERASTFGLEAQGNLDFRSLTARPRLEPLPGLLPQTQRTTLGVFAQDSWTAAPRLVVTAGARWDHYSDVGSVVSPRAAAVFTLPKDVGLKLLYGRAFRPPSFAELAFDLPGLGPNPDLEPARVDTGELALSYKKGDWRLSADAFMSWLRDPIGTPEPYSPLRPQQLLNLPGIDLRGFELELRRNFGVSDFLFVSYTHQSAEDHETGLPRADVPQELAAFGATFHYRERLIATPSVLLRSSRPRAAGDSRQPVPGYGLVNLHLRARNVVKTLELSLTLSNLLGTRYADPAPLGGLPGDYPRPGRTALLNAAYVF